jgi:hypothetical protein
MDFQLRRHMFENLRDVFTDAIFGASAAIADLLFGRQIQFVPMVRQAGEIKFSATATTSMARNLLTCFGRSNICDIVRRRQIEQVPLAFPFDNAFTPPSMYPTFVPSEFFEFRSEFLLEFCVRVRRRIQHTVQFGDLLPRFFSLSFKLNGLLVGS